MDPKTQYSSLRRLEYSQALQVFGILKVVEAFLLIVFIASILECHAISPTVLDPLSVTVPICEESTIEPDVPDSKVSDSHLYNPWR